MTLPSAWTISTRAGSSSRMSRWCRAYCSMASWPVLASATTSIDGRRSSIARKPCRTKC
ncbi:MAG: hypothetical protein JOZ63_02910 [Planctomycetaceae bacterium]|nr:hypothetical protein [Planctomycetaceae bacterium]